MSIVPVRLVQDIEGLQAGWEGWGVRVRVPAPAFFRWHLFDSYREATEYDGVLFPSVSPLAHAFPDDVEVVEAVPADVRKQLEDRVAQLEVQLDQAKMLAAERQASVDALTTESGERLRTIRELEQQVSDLAAAVEAVGRENRRLRETPSFQGESVPSPDEDDDDGPWVNQHWFVSIAENGRVDKCEVCGESAWAGVHDASAHLPKSERERWRARRRAESDLSPDVGEDDSEGSDGDLLAHLGADAAAWAKRFVALFKGMTVASQVDEGLMIGWFANAIEAGRSANDDSVLAYLHRLRDSNDPVLKAVSTLVDELKDLGR